MESPRLREDTVYGPVPIGLFARSATPPVLNIAPSLLVRLNSQPLLGFVSKTRAWSGATTSTRSTTSIVDLIDTVQSVFTRIRENLTSSAVNGAPLLNFASSRSLKS